MCVSVYACVCAYMCMYVYMCQEAPVRMEDDEFQESLLSFPRAHPGNCTEAIGDKYFPSSDEQGPCLFLH